MSDTVVSDSSHRNISYSACKSFWVTVMSGRLPSMSTAVRLYSHGTTCSPVFFSFSFGVVWISTLHPLILNLIMACSYLLFVVRRRFLRRTTIFIFFILIPPTPQRYRCFPCLFSALMPLPFLAL